MKSGEDDKLHSSHLCFRKKSIPNSKLGRAFITEKSGQVLTYLQLFIRLAGTKDISYQRYQCRVLEKSKCASKMLLLSSQKET